MSRGSLSTTNIALPLCIDLDGTLVRTDTLLELLLVLLKQKPVLLALLPGWIWRGKAYVKEQIAQRAPLNVALLPYHQELLSYLHEEHARGRKLYLATAAHTLIADRVAAHLGIFEGVIATNGGSNLSGVQKARALSEKFGRGKFAYAGNSFIDLLVWQVAAEAVVVSANKALQRRVRRIARVTHVFAGPSLSWSRVSHLLRTYQWTKNLLLFVPLLAAHRVPDPLLFRTLACAFVAFCFAASAAYVINDLADLESDRRHAKKRKRPLARGEVSLTIGVVAPVILISLSGVLAWFVSVNFFLMVALYFSITLLYSLFLKQLALVDVFTLAGLYNLRIFAGAIAVTVPVSSWLAAFALFFFLSLALVKRFAELVRLQKENITQAAGRGYVVSDASAIAQFGTASAYLSALVLALYISSDEVSILYASPSLLWISVPLLLFWLSRVWFLAHRHRLEDDPLLFAIRDPLSYFIAVLVLGVALIAI